MFEINIWFVAFFWTLCGFVGYVIGDQKQLHKLRKDGKFVSRRGTYTFTPKEKKE